MSSYTPEQVEAIAAKLADSVSIDNGRATGPVAAPMLYAYAATLRQQAGRVDASDLDVLRRLRDALPTVGLNGWMAGVGALDAAITALAQNTQGEAVAWRECYGTIIKALAAMTHVGAPDHWPEDAIQRDPIMEQVRRIRQALDTFGKKQCHAERARVPELARALVDTIDNECERVTSDAVWAAKERLQEQLTAAPSQRAEVK